MKIRNIVITFWFNKINTREIVDNISTRLASFFSGINFQGLPANIDNIVPRISAVSNSGHTNMNISNINAQININFDSHFEKDYDKCFEYTRERLINIYDALIDNKVEILYSAIFVNVEKNEIEPIEQMKKIFNQEIQSKDYGELGIHISNVIEGKFYRNINMNNAKQISITKEINQNQKEIIFPLISLYGANIVENSISLTYEINDKYSFDSKEKYKTEKKILEDMFKISRDDIENNIENFVETGSI